MRSNYYEVIILMNKWILVAILILAAFFRTYQLSTVPPSPSLDEVSIGYNAYSILQTGKDEYGTPLPVLLRAYDDWRPALYAYSVTPFVKVFGLNALAVRLPSVILSILTVLLTYFVALRLLKKDSIALCASLLLAISPWHIYLSRLGHEVNLGLFADVAGAFFFLEAIERKTIRSLLASAVFFILALYSYQSQKVIVPVILLGLLILYAKQLWEMRKGGALAAVIFAILLIPLLQASLTQDALIRFKATSAFTLDNPEMQKKQYRLVAATKIFWTNYISHFDPRWLFTGSERENHKVPNLGLLYWWELPLMLLGLFKLIFHSGKLSKRFIFLWLLASPLPGAISTQAPHAMRDISVLPYWQIVGAVGAISFWEALKNYRVYITTVATILLTVSLWFFARQYYLVFPQTQSDSFQYALTQSIPYVLSNEQKYQSVVFSNQNNLYQSYMFFLFHSRYDPDKYVKDGGTVSGGFAEPHSIDKYEFRPISWKEDMQKRGTLFIGNIFDFSSDAKVMQEFQYLNGLVGVIAVTP